MITRISTKQFNFIKKLSNDLLENFFKDNGLNITIDTSKEDMIKELNNKGFVIIRDPELVALSLIKVNGTELDLSSRKDLLIKSQTFQIEETGEVISQELFQINK